MTVDLSPEAVTFTAAGTPAGRYVLDDAFKPYINPLRTPDGHLVSDCMPVDHRHHKGMMYALRCADLNFWEELPGTDQAGVQHSLSVEALTTGCGKGIRQQLRWAHSSGERPTYDETREIVCRHEPEQRAFIWTWSSRRTALRSHRVIKSEWSLEVADGRRINYHGLGIRMPRSWAFPGDGMNGVECAGTPKPWREACGTTGPQAGFWGKIDGHWNPPVAFVGARQDHGFAWFVLNEGFSYISAGPSNLEEFDVEKGQIFSETYRVIVQDRWAVTPAA